MGLRLCLLGNLDVWRYTVSRLMNGEKEIKKDRVCVCVGASSGGSVRERGSGVSFTKKSQFDDFAFQATDQRDRQKRLSRFALTLSLYFTVEFDSVSLCRYQGFFVRLFCYSFSPVFALTFCRCCGFLFIRSRAGAVSQSQNSVRAICKNGARSVVYFFSLPLNQRMTIPHSLQLP